MYFPTTFLGYSVAQKPEERQLHSITLPGLPIIQGTAEFSSQGSEVTVPLAGDPREASLSPLLPSACTEAQYLNKRHFL
uniref:Uncharacterized protein n=1 Tax=Anguilla anguilla TaxID=7936 RepID=A0A0E9WVA8_ANGAN